MAKLTIKGKKYMSIKRLEIVSGYAFGYRTGKPSVVPATQNPSKLQKLPSGYFRRIML